MSKEPVAVTSVEQLVDVLQLAKMHTYELVATARDEHEEFEADAEPSEPGNERVKVRTGVRTRESALDYRVEFSVEHSRGQLIADFGAFYESENPLNLTSESAEAVIEFGDRVAMMALFPYLRQAIGDMGLRVGVEITLPMVRPGELTFAPSDEEESAEEQEE